MPVIAFQMRKQGRREKYNSTIVSQSSGFMAELGDMADGRGSDDESNQRMGFVCVAGKTKLPTAVLISNSTHLQLHCIFRGICLTMRPSPSCVDRTQKRDCCSYASYICLPPKRAHAQGFEVGWKRVGGWSNFLFDMHLIF